jgi:hypothetical protein
VGKDTKRNWNTKEKIAKTPQYLTFKLNLSFKQVCWRDAKQSSRQQTY